MRVIHFTWDAADAFLANDASGARFVPLADGSGDTLLGCLHLDKGAVVSVPSKGRAVALLVVQGRITITSHSVRVGLREYVLPANIDIVTGVGVVFEPNESHALKSSTGAIVFIVESGRLHPHRQGISTPGRIDGAIWPGDAVAESAGHRGITSGEAG